MPVIITGPIIFVAGNTFTHFKREQKIFNDHIGGLVECQNFREVMEVGRREKSHR